MYALLLILLSSLAFADTNIFGHVAQSVVYSDGVSVGGSSGKISFDKTEIQVGGDTTINNNTSLRFAVATTDEAGLKETPVIIQYALADRNFNLDDRDMLGVRVGKVPHSLGFYNRYRPSPESTPLIYLPDSIYREQFKYLAMSGWGAQAYFSHDFGVADTVSVTLTRTKPELTNNSEIVSGHFNDPTVGTFEGSKSWVNGLTVEYQKCNWLFYYNLTNLNFNFEANPNLHFPSNLIFKSGYTDTLVHTAGMKYYTSSNVDFAVEYLRVQKKGEVWDNISKFVKPFGFPEGVVLSSTWSPYENHTFMVYHNEYYINSKDRGGEKESAITGQLPYEAFIRSNSLAYKYDYDKSWHLKAQYVWGVGVEPFLKSLNSSTDRSWRYIALQAVYAF